jgi:hypothetical protein
MRNLLFTTFFLFIISCNNSSTKKDEVLINIDTNKSHKLIIVDSEGDTTFVIIGKKKEGNFYLKRNIKDDFMKAGIINNGQELFDFKKDVGGGHYLKPYIRRNQFLGDITIEYFDKSQKEVYILSLRDQGTLRGYFWQSEIQKIPSFVVLYDTMELVPKTIVGVPFPRMEYSTDSINLVFTNPPGFTVSSKIIAYENGNKIDYPSRVTSTRKIGANCDSIYTEIKVLYNLDKTFANYIIRVPSKKKDYPQKMSCLKNENNFNEIYYVIE